MKAIAFFASKATEFEADVCKSYMQGNNDSNDVDTGMPFMQMQPVATICKKKMYCVRQNAQTEVQLPNCIYLGMQRFIILES